MAPFYYWLSWLIVIIAIFFIEGTSLKQTLLLFAAVVMCLYSLNAEEPLLQLIHPAVLVAFGVRFWLMKTKKWLSHVWPFIFSLVCTSLYLFLIVSPLWMEFPLKSIGVCIFLFAMTFYLGNLCCAIGFWLLLNGLGILWTTIVFWQYELGAVLDLNQKMLTVLQGVLILFVIYGVLTLKKWSYHYRSKKGVAHA
ncbi:YphA family membrane protein [Halobacillus salinus]|uniref:Uncharacterized protein n=1 Tax=Halobacillus salinus TaxID=192814 RepID=A0A4Z0H3S6_9BACI|nr:hypothetical protein [Halobacillus salinus]TGB04517.1 hypothetical protein E4663_05860 [Halobacillus salinus]